MPAVPCWAAYIRFLSRCRLNSKISRKLAFGLLCITALTHSSVAPCGDKNNFWPDLADKTSYSFASNRLSFPSGVLSTDGSSLAGLSHVAQFSPPYPVFDLKILFANFYVSVSGGPKPERCPGNAKSVDFATAYVDGKAYPITFKGAVSAKIADCGFVWSDVISDPNGKPLHLDATTKWFIRSSQSVGPGEKLTSGTDYQAIASRYSNVTLGDGVEYTSGPQVDKRFEGTVRAYQKGSGYVGPAMAIARGWSGQPVFLVVGDSIAAGQADLDVAPNLRGVAGYISRALDDSARSQRMNFVNLAVPGTRQTDQSSAEPGEFNLRMQVLHSIPNRPFNRILSEMGQNGLSASLPQFQGEMRRWWLFLQQMCPNCALYQTTYLPHARQIEQQFWTDTSHQVSNGSVDGYPAGIRWRAIDWLIEGTGLPKGLRVLAITNVFSDPNQPALWRRLSGSWKLDVALSERTTSITVSGDRNPVVGDWYVIEPGRPSAETRQAYRVSGTSPYTLTFTTSIANGHPTGSLVLPAPTGDGTHPGTSLHRAASEELIGMKTNGLLK